MASFFHTVDTLTPEERRLDKHLLRYVANTAKFHALCRQMNGGCYRAQRCRGDAHECVGRFMRLVPDDAWYFIKATLRGQRDKVPLDDLVAEYPGEYEAIQEWRAALAGASTCRRRKTRRS